MKDRTKGFLAGVLTATLVLGLSRYCLCGRHWHVSFNSVNLRFNSKQISAKGENYTIGTGASIPASILYTDENGGSTTYLPIARISELLGTEIGWDSATGSVLIGEKPVEHSVSDATMDLNLSDFSEPRYVTEISSVSIRGTEVRPYPNGELVSQNSKY